MHCHMDFYEFCIIVGGSYQNIYHGEKHSCTIGHLLFFRPGETHSLIETSPNSYHYSCIIKKKAFEEFCRNHQLNAEKILNTPFLIQKTSSVQFAYVSQLASHLAYSIIDNDSMPILYQFLSALLFACFVAIPDDVASSNKIYAVDVFQAFNRYEGLTEDITELYKQYPLSRTVLINDFKKLTGYTLVQYRNLKRMEYAANLLSQANYAITDICNMLNIESPSHFSKQFKKQYGVSPKHYQQLQRSKKEEPPSASLPD